MVVVPDYLSMLWLKWNIKTWPLKDPSLDVGDILNPSNLTNPANIFMQNVYKTASNDYFDYEENPNNKCRKGDGSIFLALSFFFW